jgi:hypothetical protein
MDGKGAFVHGGDVILKVSGILVWNVMRVFHLKISNLDSKYLYYSYMSKIQLEPYTYPRFYVTHQQQRLKSEPLSSIKSYNGTRTSWLNVESVAD